MTLSWVAVSESDTFEIDILQDCYLGGSFH